MTSIKEHRVSAHLPESLLTWGKVEPVGGETLIAGEFCNLEIRVRVQKPIEPGLSIEVWTHFVSDLARAQIDDPGGPAWFDCESDDVPVETRAYPDAKVHGPGAFFPYRRYAASGLPKGAAAGDRLLFRFRKVAMQTYEESLFNLRFAILASERNQVIGYLGDAFYEVVGGPPAALRVVAPTCVETGEPFDCRIVVCDRFGNKTGGELENLSFEIDTEAGPEPVAPGRPAYEPEWRRHKVRGLRCPAEGVYYLRARLKGADPEIAGVGNPIVARRRWDERLIWGDLHQHAYYCDGRGTPDANYAYAVSTSCLDFCSVTPHEECTFSPGLLNIPSPPQKGWEEMIEAAEKHNGEELVTILGSEPGGVTNFISHVNVYYQDPGNRPLTERIMGRWWESSAPKPRVESYEEFLDELARTKGEYLLLPHAHAGGGPGKFDLPVLPAFQTNVEICSVHGVFEEFYAQWLAHGHYVGVHGGGDNHMTSTGAGNPGYHYPNTNGLAGAWVKERSRRSVWDAFKHRKTCAVTGNRRIFLDLQVDGEPVGSVIAGGRGPRSIRIEAAGTAPLMRVDLLRNGEAVHTYRPAAQSRRVLRLTWTDDWVSRRVDDSTTTGTASLEGGRLRLLTGLNAYHPTDVFTERDGVIDFRSNAYSGITRGLLAEVSGAADSLRFRIHDMHRGETVLSATLRLSLEEEHSRLVRDLETGGKRQSLFFTCEPPGMRFILEADWVDPDWERTAQLEWRDEDDTDAFYTARAEQIDGNITWSSPIWCQDRPPAYAVPGRVVTAKGGAGS